MELTLHKRSRKTKGENTKIRLSGGIPAILYGQAIAENEPVYVLKSDLDSLLRKTKKNHLSTVLLNVKQDNKTFKALIKDIQYNFATYEIEHIDFLKVDGKEVTVKVPLEFHGVENCAGVKMGGFLRKVLRSVKVKCLPEHMPKGFVVDVANLNIMQSKKVSDLQVDKNVKILADPKQVLIIVGKMKG